MIEAQATAVARAYLEEISLAGFCDPEYDPDENDATGCRQECVASGKGCGGAGCGAQGGRAGFDDICDYLGLDDDGARDRRDLALPALAAYRLRVGVVDEGVELGDPALSADRGQVLRIDVSVGHAGLATLVRLSTYRANLE